MADSAVPPEATAGAGADAGTAVAAGITDGTGSRRTAGLSPAALSAGASVLAVSDLAGSDLAGSEFTSSRGFVSTSGLAAALSISCLGSTFALSSVPDSALAGSAVAGSGLAGSRLAGSLGSLAIEGSSVAGGLPGFFRCFAESRRPSGPRSVSARAGASATGLPSSGVSAGRACRLRLCRPPSAGGGVSSGCSACWLGAFLFLRP